MGQPEQTAAASNMQARLGVGWYTADQRAFGLDTWLLVPALPLPPGTTCTGDFLRLGLSLPMCE